MPSRFLISKVFIELYINHDEFFSENHVLRECNKMKKEIKNLLNKLYMKIIS